MARPYLNEAMQMLMKEGEPTSLIDIVVNHESYAMLCQRGSILRPLLKARKIFIRPYLVPRKFSIFRLVNSAFRVSHSHIINTAQPSSFSSVWLRLSLFVFEVIFSSQYSVLVRGDRSPRAHA